MKTQELIDLENSINHQIIESIKDNIIHSEQIMDAIIINQARIDLVNAEDIRYIDHINDTIEKTLN